MCQNPDERLAMARVHRDRAHPSLAEGVFYGEHLFIILYPEFFERFADIIKPQDYARCYINPKAQTIRICAQPLKGVGVFRLGVRSGCKGSRQIRIATNVLANDIQRFEGRKDLTPREEKRSIVFQF